MSNLIQAACARATLFLGAGACAVAVTALATGCGTSSPSGTTSAAVQPPQPAPVVSPPHPTPRSQRPATVHISQIHTPAAVGLRVVTFVDHRRHVRLPDGRTVPRSLRTVIRYPAAGPYSRGDERGAAPARSAGPYPLIVFGHGFAVTPGTYQRLLRAWARAGYIVAAPYFPLGNANAPGGPDESDLPNQPADMSFVISQMLTANRVPHGAFGGLIAPQRIAVSGQSDGGDTALAVAYDPQFVDHRVGAVVILSGQQIPGVGALTFPPPAPPLLAVQGTADQINLPSTTRAFFDPAPRPKFLEQLPGAGHIEPYTTQQPQLDIVARVTIAFLDRYLYQRGAAAARLRREGDVSGVATLTARP